MNYKNKDDNDSVSSKHPSSFTVSSRGEDDGGIMTTELGARDVLLGRGTGPNEHIGNVRYRALLVHKATQVGGTKNYASLSSTKKRVLAKEVVASVKAMGGRFMKHAAHNNKSGAGGGTTVRYYVEVPDNVAVNKVKQGFRHQIKAQTFKRKDRINSKTTSRETMTGKNIKPKYYSQRPPTAGYSPLIVDTSREKSLPEVQKRLLPVGGEKYDSLPPFSKVDTAVCRPDFSVQGIAPSIMDHARPFTAMNVPGSGVRMNTMGGHLDRLYYGQPRSMMWLPHQRWLAPFSTMVTSTVPPQFLRRSPPIFPQRHPFSLQLAPFTGGTGNTEGLEWDPCVSGLLALRVERPNNDMVLYDAPAIRQSSLA